MSAFLVDTSHINVLVSYFASRVQGEGLWIKLGDKYTYLTPDNGADLGYELHKENCKSLDYRYNEHNTDENYKFEYIRHAKDEYSVNEISGAIDCLEYQSCEHEDYHTSDAYWNLCSMRKHLLRRLAEDAGESTWEISKLKEPTRRYI